MRYKYKKILSLIGSTSLIITLGAGTAAATNITNYDDNVDTNEQTDITKPSSKESDINVLEEDENISITELHTKDNEIIEHPINENKNLLVTEQIEDVGNYYFSNSKNIQTMSFELTSDNVTVGVTWDPVENVSNSVTIRDYTNGEWSDWTPLEIVAGNNILGSEPFSLAYTENVEIVVTGETKNLKVVIIGAEEDEVNYHNDDFNISEALSSAKNYSTEEVNKTSKSDTGNLPSEMNHNELKVLKNISNDGKVFNTGTGLKINTRKSWGADESKMTWTPQNIKIQGAVIHHTEGNNAYTKDQVPQQIRNIYHYHAVTLGWGDIGYNLIVDKYGGVWEGRKGGIDKGIKGAHALGANSETFGITVLGSYMTTPPPTIARENMSKAIAWKLKNHGITSSTSTIRVPGEANVRAGKNSTIEVSTVSAHRDVGWTDCPGNAFYSQMNTIRTEVNNYLKSGVTTPTTPPTANNKTFDPSLVITDKNFFNHNSMTLTEIQNFLNTAGATCKPGSGKTCLKDTKFPTSKLTSLRGGCKPINLSGNQSAAKIIYETSKSCQINPQVLLATLQKESSGVVQPLSNDSWAKSMGSACPDGKPCDPKQAGFQKQIYYGADKLVSYSINPTWETYVLDHRAGRSSTIPNNVDPKCGSQTIKIQNDATASLYMYTPYIGDSKIKGCGVVGAKSFHDIMLRWFPETVNNKPTLTGNIGLNQIPLLNVTLTPTYSFSPQPTKVSFQWFKEGVKIPNATQSFYKLSKGDSGKKITVEITGERDGYEKTKITTSIKALPGSVSRISGLNRYETNNLLTNKEKNKPIFIATGENFADALSITPAVRNTGGSLFLVKRSTVPANTLNLIKAKNPNIIYIIGGDGVVSPTVEKVLSSIGKTERISGKNRYETSQKIYEKFFKTSSTVFISTGNNYPDALSAASAASLLNSPVLLVNNSNPFKTLKNTVKNIYIVGGENVVNNSLVHAPQKTSIQRLSGTNRYETNIEVNKMLNEKKLSNKNIIIATGENFPDALTAGANLSNYRLVLSRKQCLTNSALDYISKANVSNVKVIGSESILSEKVENLKNC